MFAKKVAIMASAVLLFTPLASFGQAVSGFQQGDREFTIVGSGSSDESFDDTVFSTSLSIGQFFTDGLEAGIRQDINFFDSPGDNDWSGSTRLFGDYHFGSGRLVPLIGISIGYVYGDHVNDQFIAGPEAGLKFFVNDTTFLYGMLEYQILFDDADEIDDAFDDGRFVYGIGLGLTF